jgi:hypothetical protein
MYENGKIKPVETILRMRGGGCHQWLTPIILATQEAKISSRQPQANN